MVRPRVEAVRHLRRIDHAVNEHFGSPSLRPIPLWDCSLQMR